jgi:hypothetical protein
VSRKRLQIGRVSAHFDVFACDVTPLLPESWSRDLRTLTDRFGYLSQLDGSSVTSRNGAFRTEGPSRLTVVDGDTVEDAAPWLADLYRGSFVDLANSLGLGSFASSLDVRSAINLNRQGQGQRYEWHVDSNPLTGVLFATTAGPNDGGDLVFVPDPLRRPESDWEVRVSPVAGTLVLFDARRVAHHVEAVTSSEPRISVPMNYYLSDRGIERPDDLDAYLYEDQS